MNIHTVRQNLKQELESAKLMLVYHDEETSAGAVAAVIQKSHIFFLTKLLADVEKCCEQSDKANAN